MSRTYPNQKWIHVHKPQFTGTFLSVQNDEWMAANKDLTPYGLQLYLYLAANANSYEFGLSPEHVESAIGMKRTSYYKYLKLLEEKGYLVWRHTNMFDFYTTPRPEKERTSPEQRKENDDSTEKSQSLFGEHSSCERFGF